VVLGWCAVTVTVQVMSVVGILQDETDPMVSVMKVRADGCERLAAVEEDWLQQLWGS